MTSSEPHSPDADGSDSADESPPPSDEFSDYPASPAPQQAAEEIPPRPEEDIADAARATPADADDLTDYPSSPRPQDGTSLGPSPDLADPGYHPPDYPTETADGDDDHPAPSGT